MTKSYLSIVANLVNEYFYISLISIVISFRDLQLDGEKIPSSIRFEWDVHSAALHSQLSRWALNFRVKYEMLAQSISECCSTQSKEHYITKGLFSDKMIYVENAPFLNGKSQEISKASLTKKCLCKRHNESLSKYDDEAILFGTALKEIVATYMSRRSGITADPLIKTICLEKFSRWFLKTFLGFIEFFKFEPRVNNDFLAALVFSETPISSHIEFSIDMDIREDFQITESISVAPVESNKLTCGMQIELYGIRITGVFHEKPSVNQNPLNLEFYDYPKTLVCRLDVG